MQFLLNLICELFMSYRVYTTILLLLLSHFLRGQCDYFYVTIAPDFVSTAPTAVFRLDLTNGNLTRVTPDIAGFQSALGTTPSANKFYMAHTPETQNQLYSIYNSTSSSPLVDTPLVNSNLKIGGPRLCVSIDGQYVYSVTSIVPGSESTPFHVRRSNISTGIEDTAQVVDNLGVPFLSNSDGDVHMTTEGKLYMIDGPGKLFEIDLSTWSGTHVTGKLVGSFKPVLPFEEIYAIGQDQNGNLIAMGSSSTIYKLRIPDKKALPIGTINYNQAYPSLRTFTTDAASCSYNLFHTVSGYVFFDANQNGTKEISENGTTQVLYAKIMFGKKVFSVATVDPITGFYKFDVNIPNSDYKVIYSTNNIVSDTNTILPPGFSSTTPIEKYITVNNADVNNINFGLYSASLAVDLVKFYAEKKGATVELNWITTSETNSNYFEIERSNDGVNFEVIGIKAAAGESTKSLSYQFIDAHPLNGNNYYRLKEIDKKYNYTYSSITSVYYTTANGFMVVSPNPINSLYKINLNSVSTGNYLLQIFNFSGMLIEESQFELNESKLELNRSADSLEKGWYYIRVFNKDNNHQFVEKISISK